MQILDYANFSLLHETLVETRFDDNKRKLRPLLKVDIHNNIYFYTVIKDETEKVQLAKKDSHLFQTRTKGEYDYHYETIESTLF